MDDAPRAALLEELLGEPLAVVDTGITLSEDGISYPTAVVDVADRPDVADLARVHVTDGVGDVTTSALPDPEGVRLVVVMSRPVVCGFQIAFGLPAHGALLRRAAIDGHLLLATSLPSSETADPAWLAVDLDGERLRAAMDALT